LYFDTDLNQTFIFSESSRNPDQSTASPGWDAVGVRYHFPSTTNLEPSGIKDGELWFDATNKQLNIYSSASSTKAAGSDIIGPIFPKGIAPANLSGFYGASIQGVPVIIEVIDGVPITLTSPTDVINSGGTAGPNNEINLGVFPSSLYKGINLSNTVDSNNIAPRFNGPASSLAADVAERFASDIAVEPGDLVKIGGTMDVTKTKSSLDQNVFGVVSTNPAYMMNDGLGEGEMFPFIALAGRVPVKIVGPVEKGQRLVSSNIPGVAKAIDNSQVVSSYVSVFGRAMVTDLGNDVRLVDAVVGVK
jgi:hypothetical protein